MRLRPPEERASSADVFKILRNSFGEGLTSYQAMQTFYERRQKERETIQEYSHALMVLLSRVERLAPGCVSDRDQLLRDQFTGNLYDLQLRRDIKRWQREHPTRTFQQEKEEVQRWVDEDGRPHEEALWHARPPLMTLKTRQFLVNSRRQPVYRRWSVTLLQARSYLWTASRSNRNVWLTTSATSRQPWTDSRMLFKA